MKINKVFGTFICVKFVEIGEKSQGGIILPDSVREKNKIRAIVHSFGEGYYHHGKLVPIDLKIGDKIIFSPNTATSGIKDEKTGEEFFFLQYHDVIAVIED